MSGPTAETESGIPRPLLPRGPACRDTLAAALCIQRHLVLQNLSPAVRHAVNSFRLIADKP